MEQRQMALGALSSKSYGYEDFVEGIRPRLSGESDENLMSENGI